MRTLKNVYPDYADRVLFIGIGQDPSESARDVREYAEDNGYPWGMAPYDGSVILDYRVIQQSSKVAVNGAGVITFRDGYGKLSTGEWRDVFEELIGE